MKYNLVNEQWIPVLLHNAKFTRMGIREALLHAHEIRQIAASNPMDRAAVLRFLLAVLYWCKGNPPENAGERALCLRYAQARDVDRPPEWADGFPEAWFAEKLGAPGQPGTHYNCFNLLGDGPRFLQYQVPGAKEDLLSINYLIHEIPTGINVHHFRHALDNQDGLCPACCALGLLRLPMFATSAGRGKPPGVNSKPPAYAMPLGRSLAETLLLNWQSAANLGDPLWVDPARGIPAVGSIPLLAGLTWAPRRMWLEAPGAPGACIACGARGSLVRRMVYAPIGSSKTDDDSPGREWTDPHVIYTELKKGVRASFHARDALGNTDAAANQWLRILAGLVEQWRAGGSPQQNKVSMDCLWLVGFATVQNDKYLEALEWRFPVPSAAGDLAAAAGTLSQWLKGSGKFRASVNHAARGGGNRKSAEVAALLTYIKPHVEHTLSHQAARLAGTPPDVWRDAAVEAYAPMMHALAQALAPGASVADTRKRQKLSRLAPQPQESSLTKQGKRAPKLKVTPRIGGQP